MTISNTIVKAGPFAGNGVTTAFPFTFRTFQKADVKVIKTSAAGVDSTLVLDSAYSVALNADQNANPGGTVTYPISGTLLATGEKLTLVSNAGDTQGTNLANQGGFFPNNVSDMSDYRTVISHQLAELLTRVAKIPVTDGLEVNDLPKAANRANQFYGWDANGQPMAASAVAGVTATSFGQAIVQAASYAAMRVLLGLDKVGVVSAAKNLTARTNSGTPNSKIDISADEITLKDSTGLPMTVSTVAVTIDIAAAVGANALDTGTEAVSTWYYGWVIAKADGTIAGLLSTSATAPTLPNGYTFKALASAVRNNGAGNFVAYRQFGNRVHYEGAQNALTSTTINTVETTLSVASQVPAIATAIDLHVNGDVQASGGVFSASLRLRYISGSNFCSMDAQSSNGGTGSINTSREFPNVSQQVFYNWSNVTNLNTQFVLVDVLGFRLPIGGQ